MSAHTVLYRPNLAQSSSERYSYEDICIENEEKKKNVIRICACYDLAQSSSERYYYEHRCVKNEQNKKNSIRIRIIECVRHKSTGNTLVRMS